MLKSLNLKNLDRQQTLSLLITAVMAVGFACVLELFFLPELAHILNGKRMLVYAFMLAALLIPAGVYFGVIKKVDWLTLSVVLLLVGAAVAARVGFMDYESSDYQGYLAQWVHELKIAPGVSRWKEDLGDYNMPYIYFLTLVAKQPLTPLYIIKMFSVLFDFVLAYYMMRISSIWLKSVKKEIAVFVAVLFFPTLIINSAYWGQCDSIYAAFAIAGLYYSVTQRPYLGISMLAIAFSFKLQTVFILPILAVLLLAKKINLKHLLAFPITFFATLLPAFFAGKPVLDTLMIYVNQTGNYSRLSMSIPNIYAFVNGNMISVDQFSTWGLFLAGAVMVAIIYFAWVNRDYIDEKEICVLAFLFVVSLPYFLPRMHERYFFMADVLSITVFLSNYKRWYVPIIMFYASIRAYSLFLIEKENVDLVGLSVLVFIVMALTVCDLIKRVNEKKTFPLQPKVALKV